MEKVQHFKQREHILDEKVSILVVRGDGVFLLIHRELRGQEISQAWWMFIFPENINGNSSLINAYIPGNSSKKWKISILHP